MSSSPGAGPLTDTTPPRVAGRAKSSLFSNEFGLRVLFGALLALAAVLATIGGGYFFASFVTLAALAALREWHRLAGVARYGREWAVSGFAVTAALLAAMLSAPVWLVLAVGAFLSALLGAVRGKPVWGGLGVLYIGVPAWSLVALRGYAPGGIWIVLGVFLTIWTADTGALLVGQAIGGPKLVPTLSPNKTWAGLAGGLVLPAFVIAVYVAILGGRPLSGFAIGLLLAAAGHSGDLFESWIKRRVGRKNSGELIPGHGGVLDRLDSTLFVAPLAAALIFSFGVYRLLGVHP